MSLNFMVFLSMKKEFEFVVTETKKLIDSGVSAKNICVVARTHKLLDDLFHSLQLAGCVVMK